MQLPCPLCVLDLHKDNLEFNRTTWNSRDLMKRSMSFGLQIVTKNSVFRIFLICKVDNKLNFLYFISLFNSKNKRNHLQP